MPCVVFTMSCLNNDHMSNDVHTGSIKSNPTIYHERQVRELCALHALNNLFQDRNAFTRKMLDDICEKLSPNHYVNPHKSFFGLGNYDVNVIMAAVQTRDCEAIWFDKRRNVDEIDLDEIIGFILNIPIEYKLGFLRLPSYRKHWIGVRRIDQLYYNLDSKLERPEVIGGDPELLGYLREHLNSHDKELLLIVSRLAAENRTWRKTRQNDVT